MENKYLIQMDTRLGWLNRSIIDFNQLSVGTCLLEFELTDNRVAYDLTDKRVMIEVLTPSGATKEEEVTVIEAIAGKFEKVLSAGMITEQGIHYLELSIYSADNAKLLCTGKARYSIGENYGEKNVVESSQYSTLQQCIIDVKTVEGSIGVSADLAGKAQEDAEKAKLDSSTSATNSIQSSIASQRSAESAQATAGTLDTVVEMAKQSAEASKQSSEASQQSANAAESAKNSALQAVSQANQSVIVVNQSVINVEKAVQDVAQSTVDARNAELSAEASARSAQQAESSANTSKAILEEKIPVVDALKESVNNTVSTANMALSQANSAIQNISNLTTVNQNMIAVAEQNIARANEAITKTTELHNVAQEKLIATTAQAEIATQKATEASDQVDLAKAEVVKATQQVGLAQVEVGKATEKATEATNQANRAQTEADRAGAVAEEKVNAKIGLNGVFDSTNLNFLARSDKTIDKIRVAGIDYKFAGEKGDKGDPGTASVAINDNATNTEQTWTSMKIKNENGYGMTTGYQQDYVDMLSSQMGVSECYVKCFSPTDPYFDIMYKLSDTRGLRYGFSPNGKPLDVYSTLQYGNIGDWVFENVVRETVNYSKKIGTFIETYAPNCHTTTVGDKIEITFSNADAIKFNHYSDDRGGLWKFILDDDVENPVIVSTFENNPTVNKDKKVLLFSSLNKNKTYKVTGEFIGIDPDNAPIGGVPRGWYKFHGTEQGENKNTFSLCDNGYSVNNSIEVLKNGSNKDFAFLMKRKAATCSAQFFPMHSNVYTVEKEAEMQVYVDGQAKSFNAGETLKFNSKVEFVQSVYCKLPEDADYRIAQLISKWTFTNDGVSEYFATFKALEDIEIINGYINMCPVASNVCKTLSTSLKNTYTDTLIDSSRTNMNAEKDNLLSIMWGNGELEDVCVALTFLDLMNTYRKDNYGIGNYNKTWIEHRNKYMQKLYPQVFNQSEMHRGEVYRFGGKFLVCNAPALSKLYF